MLEVHPPEHSIHSLKDFFLHLLTITIGLLIALGLENAAEAMHHRHQRKEAEETIRQELQENRDELVQSQKTMQTEVQAMLAVLDFLEAKEGGQALPPGKLTLEFGEHSMQDSAWRSAAATGVLTYMKYTDVQKYAVCYKTQELYETLQMQTLDDYLQLDSYVVHGFDPSKIKPEDARSALPVVRHTLAHLEGLLDVSRGALMVYDKALQ